MKIPSHQIEAAIAAILRDRWTRYQAEQWVGLPSGTLSMVVDEQGRWLNQTVMSHAVNHLPPAILQAYSERINDIHENLKRHGLQRPAADDRIPVQGSDDVERAQIHLNRPASNEGPSDTRPSAAATLSIERTTQREHATSHSRTQPSGTGQALDLPDLNLPAPEEPLPDSDHVTAEFVAAVASSIEPHAPGIAGRHRALNEATRYQPGSSTRTRSSEASSSLAVRRGMPAMPPIDVQTIQRSAQELSDSGARTIELRHERVDEQVHEAQVREILDVVAKQKSKRAFYKVILEANDERPPEKRWDDSSMRMAAGIDRSNASTVRQALKHDTPRTIEIRDFLNSSAPPDRKESSHRRYHRALVQNAQTGSKWPDKSMRTAAGIHISNAWKVRGRIAPDTPQTIKIREFLRSTAPHDRVDNSYERYRRALEKNSEPQHEPKWPDKSMQKAAGIFISEVSTIRKFTAPDTPRTEEVRKLLDSSAVANPKEYVGNRYRRALNMNAAKDGEKWPDKSMQKAAGVKRRDAHRIRMELAPDTPRTRSVREFLQGSAPTVGPDSSAQRYRRALEENHRREEDQKWPDRSMHKAAGINSSNARRVHERWIAQHTANDPQAEDDRQSSSTSKNP